MFELWRAHLGWACVRVMLDGASRERVYLSYVKMSIAYAVISASSHRMSSYAGESRPISSFSAISADSTLF